MQQPQAEQGLLIPGGWPQPVCTHEPAGAYKAAGCVFSHLAAVHEAFRSGTVSSDRAGHFGGATLASSRCCPWLLCWFIKGCMGWARGMSQRPRRSTGSQDADASPAGVRVLSCGSGSATCKAAMQPW